jgi:DNA-binding transcriptional MerR regulator
MQYFNIQVASQLSGVASATIRAWEKRYNAVVPERGDNKHRLYSEKDIEKLALLFKLTEFGQSIGKIAHLELEDLKKVYSQLMHRPYEELQVVTPHHERVDFDKILNSFFIALAAYKLDIISHELEKAKTILSPRDLCLKLLVPLFREIGNKVARDEFTIAQEHTLSAIFSFHIGQMIGLHYQKPNLKNELVLITTPEGEIHEIGILASALLCVHYGVKFIFLGANLPARSLAEAANALQPRALLLGVIKGHEISDHKTLEDYLTELSRELKVRAEIWVGGNLKPYVRVELERRKIPFFPTLDAFDEFLADL